VVPRTLMQRVEKLENTVESLVGLPAAVGELRERTSALELQIVQLRSEMKDEFSAVRREMADLRVELKEEVAGLRDDVTGVRQELAGLHGDLDQTRRGVAQMGVSLAQMRDSLSSQMLMLHEDLVSRIALIGEGRPARKPRRRH
jgi:chromosome segregation ATPase